jgi:short-subunit dehydrogenase
MDVTDANSVAVGMEQIWKDAVQRTQDGIGIIIHCAGYGIGGAAEDTPIAAVQDQMETNYFGVLRVNSEILPLMRSRSRSLVIVLGSIAGRISIPYQSHYSASKFALEAYVEALRIEGASHGIHATIVEAGDTHTEFTNKRVLAIPTDSPYLDDAKRAIGKMEQDERKGYAPEKVASVVYSVSTRRHPPVRIAVGVSYKLLMLAKRLLPDRIVEWILSRLYVG